MKKNNMITRYTIYDLVDSTNLDRTTLLQIINGRKCRNTPPLIDDRDKQLHKIDGRWTMTYNTRAYLKVIKWVTMYSRKQRKK